jgi:Mycothiol maleylpyruvate isomerase N-terminal domain
MEDLRSEHVHREAEAWAAFEDALSRVPDDRLTAPGVLEGWTVKEMLHHVTGWIRECIVYLERMREGTFVEPEETDELVDARNAAFADDARVMEIAVVRSGLDAARELILLRWRELPEIDEAAAEWFAGETYEH